MKIKLSDIYAKAEQRGNEYLVDVLSKGIISDEYLIITSDEYNKLIEKYNPTAKITVNNGSCCNKGTPNVQTQMQNVAKAIGQTVKNIVKNEPVLADTNTVNNRLDICSKCEFWIAESKRCSKCGCFTTAKTKLASQSCPIGRW